MTREKIIQLETAIDHLTGEELGMALTALNESALILDALFLPGTGKKNRPAGLLQVICRPGSEEAAARLIFRHTHTLGIRILEIERFVLPRKASQTTISGNDLPAKAYELDDGAFLRPEADAVSQLANSLNLGAPALRFSKND